MPEFRHYLRMGTHAESDYLLRARPLYDGLVFNANLVEATPGASAVLAMRLKKPFLIDPVTYAFALDPALLRSKPSRKRPVPGMRATFASLADKMAVPLPKDGTGRGVAPGDLTDKQLALMIDRVLLYQETTFIEALQENAEFVGSELEEHPEVLKPEGSFGPYFVDDFATGWRSTNLEFLQRTVELRGNLAIGLVAYDASVATMQDVVGLAVALSDIAVEHLVIWPAELDEHSSTIESLKAYAHLVASLSKGQRRTTAAYGGYFAILLSYAGLRGVTHGVGYGDRRRIEPVVGGGLPPAQFYVRAIRDSVSMATFAVLCAQLTEDEYRMRICNCEICDGLLKRGGVDQLLHALTETETRPSPKRGMVEVPTPNVYRLSRFHFLLNRHDEVKEIRTSPPFDRIAAKLRDEAQWASQRLGGSVVRHIDRWLRAVEDSANG